MKNPSTLSKKLRRVASLERRLDKGRNPWAWFYEEPITDGSHPNWLRIRTSREGLRYHHELVAYAGGPRRGLATPKGKLP